MSKTEESQAAPSPAQSLIEKLKIKEPTFKVPVADTEIEFRLPTDALDIHTVRKAAERFASNGVKKAPPSSPLSKFTRFPVETLQQAFWIHSLAIVPEFTQVQACELAECGGSLPYLYAEIMRNLGESVVQEERDLIDEAKKP